MIRTTEVESEHTQFGRMIMCHMLLDTAEELYEMANRIGLQRSWLQKDHYDVSMTKRAQAVALEAVEVTSREVVRVRRRWWEEYAPESKDARRARILDEIQEDMEA